MTDSRPSLFTSGSSGRLWLGILAAVTFLLYLLTLCPTVYLGDAGELTVAGMQLGIPHPPGYPLSTLLMYFNMKILPMASFAFRANMMSALASIFAVLFLAKLVHAVMSEQLPDAWRWPMACAVALTFGMTRVFWSQALITEVYPVMMMLYCAMLWMMYEATRRESLGPLLAAGCLYALGFVQHPTMWLMGPIIALWIAWLAWSRFRTPWVWMLLLAACIIPLSIYLYFPLRSLTNPDSDWGNPETVHRVLRHVMRKQYRAVGAGPRSTQLFLDQMLLYWTYLSEQFRWPLVVAALAGLATMWRAAKRWTAWFFVLFLLLSVGAMYFLNPLPTAHQKELIGVFLLPGVTLLAIGLGYAASAFATWWQQRQPSYAWLGAAVCCLLPLAPATRNWYENDLSRDTIAYHSAVDMLNAFPPRAVLFTAGDFTAFPLAYLTMGERRRLDVQMFDDYGSLFPNLYGDGFLELPGADQGKVRQGMQRKFLDDPERPLYTTLGADMSNWAPRLIPEGINYRVLPEHPSWAWYRFHVESSVYARWDRFNQADTPTRNILNQYRFARGEYYFLMHRPDDGLRWYKRAAANEREYEWLSNNIATMLPRRGKGFEAEWFYEWVLDLNPWYTQALSGLGNIALAQAGKAKRDGDQDLANRYFEKAQGFFRQSTEKGEPNPGGYYFLGNALADQGAAAAEFGRREESRQRYREAVDAYIKCLSWDPNNSSAHKNLAFALMEIGQKEAALEETKRAIALTPQDYQLYYNKGAIEMQLNRFAEAEASWGQAYQLNPQDQRIAQGLLMLQKRRQATPTP